MTPLAPCLSCGLTVAHPDPGHTCTPPADPSELVAQAWWAGHEAGRGEGDAEVESLRQQHAEAEWLLRMSENARDRAERRLEAIEEGPAVTAPDRPTPDAHAADREAMAKALCLHDDTVYHHERADDFPCAACRGKADALVAAGFAITQAGANRAKARPEGGSDACVPTRLRVPTNRVLGGADGALNIGCQHLDVEVVLDPALPVPGEHRPGYGGSAIVLREWNERVFLHELLHVATSYCQPSLLTTHPPHGHDVLSRIEVALWETGWRWHPALARPKGGSDADE